MKKQMVAVVMSLTLGLGLSAMADHHEGGAKAPAGEGHRKEMHQKRKEHREEMREKRKEHHEEMKAKREEHREDMKEKREAKREEMKAKREARREEMKAKKDAATPATTDAPATEKSY